MICTNCLGKFDDQRGTKVRCPKCGKFNHSVVLSGTTQGKLTTLLSEADELSVRRIATGPWDVCFGPANECEEDGSLKTRSPNYGIVLTSCTLIGGLAGAGKSTMSLQLADEICEATKREILYICAEESVAEVRLRADRINIKNKNLIRGLSTLTSSEALTQLENILNKHNPSALILDSLPGLTGKDHEGAIEVCKLIKSYAVRRMMPGVIIDHVTKSDDFAGLYALQHQVDTTMTLYPNENNEEVRTLEVLKNRFGRAFVQCQLLMTEQGLVEVEEEES